MCVHKNSVRSEKRRERRERESKEGNWTKEFREIPSYTFHISSSYLILNRQMVKKNWREKESRDFIFKLDFILKFKSRKFKVKKHFKIS
jgi:hypothetical protein